jgi:hypothetical protein
MVGTPRVLFLSPRREDYLSDGILHGLRRLLGDRVVDYPKHEVMYRSAAEAARPRIRGGGFTLYGLLEDIPIDRSRTIEELRWGEFDLVLFAGIKESFGLFVELIAEQPRAQMAVLDGDDHPSIYPYRKAWWTRREWLLLPRAHTRMPYFKRELTPVTNHYRSFRLLPGAVACRLPMLRNVHPTAFSVPEEKIFDGEAEKTQLFGRDIVDPEFKDCAPLGLRDDYLFADEADYYRDLRRSRFGITTKRGGWDCLRHYEIAANGAVPCFRDLHAKPETCAPHGLHDGNCITYQTREELLGRVETMPESEYERLRAGALRWARENSTVARATELLQALGWTAPEPAGAAELEPDRAAIA